MFKKGDKVLVEAVVVGEIDEDNEVDVKIKRRFDGLERYQHVRVEDVKKSTEQKWIPVEERLPEETKQYVVTLIDAYDEKGRVDVADIEYHGYGEWDVAGITEVIAWMEDGLPKPYSPPVKLRESCDLCKHYEESTKSGKWISEGEIEIKADAYSSVCWKTKQFTPEPHFINGKPCDEE